MFSESSFAKSFKYGATKCSYLRCFGRGQNYVARYLCSPVPMFPEPMFPGTYVPRYLCSPVPMFPGTDVPRTYVPRYLCSPNPCSPVPMFPDLRQMCCRAYIRRPSDRHWNCRAAKRNISPNIKHNAKRNKS